MSSSKSVFNSKEDVKEELKGNPKKLVYTHGLGYRNPTTHRVPIDFEKACKLINDNGLVDVKEFDDYIEINTYSGSDMW